MAAGLPYLTDLDMGHSNAVTYDAVMTLVGALPHLTSLRLGFHDNIYSAVRAAVPLRIELL